MPVSYVDWVWSMPQNIDMFVCMYLQLEGAETITDKSRHIHESWPFLYLFTRCMGRFTTNLGGCLTMHQTHFKACFDCCDLADLFAG